MLGSHNNCNNGQFQKEIDSAAYNNGAGCSDNKWKMNKNKNML